MSHMKQKFQQFHFTEMHMIQFYINFTKTKKTKKTKKKKNEKKKGLTY
jgi:hypothetical protein